MAPLAELAVTDAYELWAGSYPPEAHNALMRAEERAMLAWLPRSLCGTRLVDIGCGSGRYLLHGRRRGATCIGVDLSAAMLRRAVDLSLPVVRGDVLHLPIASGWADRAVCALTLGHTASLAAALSELARVLRVRGAALCSEPHPAGVGLGWQRTFNVGGQRYAVRHVAHYFADWYRACRSAGFIIEDIAEPRLDPSDIPAGAKFDPQALEVPVALVLKLRKSV
jgi:malonyl-CoA O-methyltransferase